MKTILQKIFSFQFISHPAPVRIAERSAQHKKNTQPLPSPSLSPEACNVRSVAAREGDQSRRNPAP